MRKETLALCGLRTFKCMCAATQKGQRCGSLLEVSPSSLYCVRKQQRLWWDCSCVHACLSLCWSPTRWVPFSHEHAHMSRIMTKPIKWPVHPAKTQISLGILQSDQNLRCPHEDALGSWLSLERTVETGQTGWMPRLIWVFAGLKGHFVGFVMRRLVCIPMYLKVSLAF